MTDPQLSLIVTDRIDPRTQVTKMPGTDAVCPVGARDCRWPFCACFCPRCGDPLTPDWVGDPNVGWCSPCNLWNFEYAPPTKQEED